MRVLVTGANGFVGAHLCRRLVDEGHDVLALVRPGARLLRLELLQLSSRVRAADFSAASTEIDAVLADFKPQQVFHLASQGIRRSQAVEAETLQANVMSTFRLLQSCAAAGVSRVVLMGSGFEYAVSDVASKEDAPLRPFSFYGVSKAAAWQVGEFFSRLGEMHVVLGRLFTVFGAMENTARIFPFVMTQLMRGQAVKLTSGRQVRDYLHVEDVIAAMLCVAERAKNGQVVNVCSGRPVTIRLIAETIANVGGMEAALLNFGAVPDRPNEPKFLLGDNTKLRELGWKEKLDLRTGVERTLAWYREAQPYWEQLP